MYLQSGEASDEVKDLQHKIKRLTQDDEVKTQRVAQLEAERAQHERLMSQLENEIGKERLDALRQHGSSNGVAHNSQSDRSRPRSNAVNPDVPQSSVCVIL